jgi:hypothetical protein
VLTTQTGGGKIIFKQFLFFLSFLW